MAVVSGPPATLIAWGNDGQLAPGQTLVRVDHRYFRPTEVTTLLGDADKARARLGWEPKVGFPELVHEMVWADLAEAQRDQLCREQGFRVMGHRE